MGDDDFTSEKLNVRGTDSNSLLRLYDLARSVSSRSPSVQERARAERAVQRIARELQRRDVRC